MICTFLLVCVKKCTME